MGYFNVCSSRLKNLFYNIPENLDEAANGNLIYARSNHMVSLNALEGKKGDKVGDYLA